MFNIRRLLGCSCFIMILASCAGQADIPPSPNATTIASAPAVAVPKPSSDQVGVVVGKLLNQRNQGEVKPMTNAPIYLGTILKSQTGSEGMVQLVKETAPKTTVDAQGNFAFTDVPPGRYGLMLDTPRGAVLLNKPVTGESMIAEVAAGKPFDFGALQYDIDVDFN